MPALQDGGRAVSPFSEASALPHARLWHSACSQRGMFPLFMFPVLMFGAIFTLPVWSYSTRWKQYPSSACIGLAALAALLVVAGVKIGRASCRERVCLVV